MEQQKTLILIFGPPAVGKMTIGSELSELTGIPLFHQHMTLDIALEFFEWQSDGYHTLNWDLTRVVFNAVSKSSLPGMIFTFVLALNRAGDIERIQSLSSMFSEEGARVIHVELYADLGTRLERNVSDFRLKRKPTKRDLETSKRRLLTMEAFNLNSSDEVLPFQNYLKIDNTDLDAVAAAKRVCDYFEL